MSAGEFAPGMVEKDMITPGQNNFQLSNLLMLLPYDFEGQQDNCTQVLMVVIIHKFQIMSLKILNLQLV